MKNLKSLRALQEKTKLLHQKFPVQWDKKTTFVDLVEEVGELANAILVAEKAKPKRRAWQGEEGLADSLCDILDVLFMMATKYDIDLEKEYRAMLKRLEKRLGNGEFEPDK
ncbi:MAG: MazG nucleotide pyrophosphohydrolase domain-containing protein [Patescibacteria group bacterium]|jgi:NTP pyrophosphatase (non-canonical NTP hydrolase)